MDRKEAGRIRIKKGIMLRSLYFIHRFVLLETFWKQKYSKRKQSFLLCWNSSKKVPKTLLIFKKYIVSL